MHIHPYAWLVTVPLAIAMIQLAIAPRENSIKRFWWMLREFEAEAWFRLGRGYEEPELTGAFKAGYAVILVLFCLLSIVSFCAFVGILPDRI